MLSQLPYLNYHTLVLIWDKLKEVIAEFLMLHFSCHQVLPVSRETTKHSLTQGGVKWTVQADNDLNGLHSQLSDALLTG